MSETNETEELQARITDMEKQLHALRQQLAELELENWQGRIDDLEVQMHLGSLEAKERLAPMIEELRDAWLTARSRVNDGVSTASDATGAIRQGLENAMRDIRDGFTEARSSINK